jgi:MFS family permease
VGSRPLRLANILDDLYTQSRLPTRLLQLFWEYRVIAKLDRYAGSGTMSSTEILMFTAAGVGVVAVAGLPLLIAWIAALIPARPLRRFRFVLVSGALSYGFTCFLGVLLLPFVLLGSGIAAQLDVDGHSDWAIALDVIVKYWAYVLLNALLVFAVAVPIYLRKKWPGLFVPIVLRPGA